MVGADNLDSIDRYILRTITRRERNKDREKQGNRPAGEDAAAALHIARSLAQEQGESPECLEDIKRLAEEQQKLDEAAKRTSPSRVKNN